MWRHADLGWFRPVLTGSCGWGRTGGHGRGKHQILYLDTCDAKQKITTSDCYDQQWPQLIVQNITLENGNSQVRQSNIN